MRAMRNVLARSAPSTPQSERREENLYPRRLIGTVKYAIRHIIYLITAGVGLFPTPAVLFDLTIIN